MAGIFRSRARERSAAGRTAGGKCNNYKTVGTQTITNIFDGGWLRASLAACATPPEHSVRSKNPMQLQQNRCL
jgi:hypothetical protein